MKRGLSQITGVLLMGIMIVLTVTLVTFLFRLERDGEPDQTGTQHSHAPIIIDTSQDYSRIESVSLSPTAQSDSIISVHGYEALTDEHMRYLYQQLDESVYKISDEVNEDGRYKTEMIRLSGISMNSVSINTAINAYLFDHPQVFWIDNYFGYRIEDEYTYVECYSVLSGNQCELYIKRFYEELSAMLSVIDPSDGKYDRERKLHDALLEKCTYKKGVDSIEDGWQYFSVYGAIVDGQAVCEGYAKAMMLMLNLVGVDCTTVRGGSMDERHMWNLVELDGSWYHLDSTWDDTEDDYTHEFFNLTTESILLDHTLDLLITDIPYTDDFNYNFFLPECTSDEMNYFVREGIVVNSLDQQTAQEIVSLICEKALNDDTIIPIKIGDDLRYSDFLNTMFENGGNTFYTYIEQANGYLDESHQMSTESCRLMKNESRKTVRVRLFNA